jgi:capsular polysaccharide biosynthesis protein
MTKEISFSFLLKVLKSAWWKILIFTVIIAVAVAAFTEFLIPKKYESSVEFYILNTSTTSEYITTSLLESAEYLASDYVTIIDSDQMISVIATKLEAAGYKNVSHQSIRSMLSAATTTASSSFTVTATSTDRNVAYIVARAIQDDAPHIIRSITRPSYSTNLYQKIVDNKTGQVEYEKIDESDLECVVPVRAPQIARTHSSPSLLIYTFLAAVVAALLSYVFFLLVKLSDTTIRSESAIKEMIDYPVTIIGSIPYWHTTAKARNDREEVK